MFVTKLTLRNFRNYEELMLDLSPSTNIFFGENAQGKTNLLEAVYFCATGRSFRTSNDKECIQAEKEEAYIGLEYEFRGRKETIEFVLRRNGRKSAKINGSPVQKINEIFGRLHLVVFSPDDLQLVKGSPLKRRKFVDMEISQVDALYLYHLQQYYLVMKQRNKLLKENRDKANIKELKEQLYGWDRQLARYGTLIMQRRIRFIEDIQGYTKKIHQSISGGKEEVKMSYQMSAPLEEEAFFEKLQSVFEKDMRYASTSIGPQHDDLALLINGIDVRVYGSQGQQRTLVLSLKMAELQMMRSQMKDDPLLLLDDVMSELDRTRQTQLTDYIRRHQTIITCTGVEDSIRQLKSDHLFEVVRGAVTKVEKEKE